MGRTLQRAGGSLTQADKDKLVPENIRYGITLFAGTPNEVTGSLITIGSSVSLDTLGANFPMVGSVQLSNANRNGSIAFNSDFSIDLTNWNSAHFTYTASGSSSSATYTIIFNTIQNGKIVKSVSTGVKTINTGGEAIIDVAGINGVCSFSASVAVSYSGNNSQLITYGVNITSAVLKGF